MSVNKDQWLVNQIGSRENYAIAEALLKVNNLHLLQTDLWFNSDNSVHRLLAKGYPNFTNRHNQNIPIEKVKHASLYNIPFKKGLDIDVYECRIRKQFLKQIEKDQDKYQTLFTYNYSAYEGFLLANKLDKNCVLGQVDAGPVAGEIITELYKKEGVNLNNRIDYYKKYLEKWKVECDIAQYIVVNSNWSKKCLIEAGIEIEKIKIVPLSFSGFSQTVPIKHYPKVFTDNRPMVVLYVGRVSLQKGCLEIIRAAKKMTKEPVIFKLVGAWGFSNDFSIEIPDNVQILGRKNKHDLDTLYQTSDLLLFPTYTDGFGKVLLEAQNFKLPLITSRYCGDVVHDKSNGKLLENNDEKSIKNALLECLENPVELKLFSDNAIRAEEFSINKISEDLLNLQSIQ